MGEERTVVLWLQSMATKVIFLLSLGFWSQIARVRLDRVHQFIHIAPLKSTALLTKYLFSPTMENKMQLTGFFFAG